MRELRLEVKLQSELKNAWVADGAGIHAEIGRSESGVGDDEVRMIEDVEGLSAESEKELFREREFFAEVHIPVLLKGTVNDIAAKIAEERAATGTKGERLIAGATIDVESGNDGAGRQSCGGS